MKCEHNQGLEYLDSLSVDELFETIEGMSAERADLLAALDRALTDLAMHINEHEGKPVCLHVRNAYDRLDAAIAKATP